MKHIFNQSHICLTFKLTRFPAIHPFHSLKSPLLSAGPPGQFRKNSGQVPPTICGTPCHANLESPDMYTALPERSRSTSTDSRSSPSWVSPGDLEIPIIKMASHPRLTLTNPVSLVSATSRCTLSVSPGEYKLTIAASAFVSVNSPSSKPLMSSGKGGGGLSGYLFAVQLYWPPNVVQRIFLLRSWAIESGLWTVGSSGVAIGEGEEDG